MRDAKTHGELKARYAKVLGRTPTEGEADRLMADLDELGVRYDDPLLVQVMLFQRERMLLEEVFGRHVGEIKKQLGEARDQVVKETDKVLTRRMGEAVVMGNQAVERTLGEQKAKLEEEHKTVLVAAVRRSTAEAVRGKFEETWGEEWAGLRERFTKDWNDKVVPALERLEGAVHHERRMGLFWFVLALVFAMAVGFAIGTRLFPVCVPAVVQQAEAPVAKPGAVKLPASGSQKK